MRLKKFLIFTLVIIFGIVSLWFASQKKAKITSISPGQFDQLAKDQQAFILDVHIPEQTHIPGTDAFISFDQIQQNLARLPKNKETPILVYCRSGSMSKQAAQKLVEFNYTNIYDLEGGINAYKQSHSLVIITPSTKNLGQVIYGKVAKTQFTLTNFTSEPLTVTRVSTSCGCTKAEVKKEKLGPYEETSILVSFDPAVHKDDTDLGDITRTIYIETDQDKFANLEVQITAKVVKKENAV